MEFVSEKAIRRRRARRTHSLTTFLLEMLGVVDLTVRLVIVRQLV